MTKPPPIPIKYLDEKPRAEPVVMLSRDVRILRIALGWTYQALAGRVGFNAATLWAVEHERPASGPLAVRLHAIADALAHGRTLPKFERLYPRKPLSERAAARVVSSPGTDDSSPVS